ncbi:MAG: signal peptidase II [Spirochaetales bacterium]|uniref:Lipoprotein signal peptidase n=1 Tax=Candidatus Thalassospirochaeta sargassi TaxID=3119039 RepID=A0AAJ1IE65_9SPIO|nr:signal peptidase II [Spirochaetales bacterium]
MSKRKGFILLIIVILISGLNFTADRITKIYAVDHIKGGGTIEVVGRVFIMHYAENDGAFLGFGGNMPKPVKSVLLVLLPSIIVLAAIFYTAFSGNIPPGQLISLSCVIGGGAGNLWDRIFNDGIVIDFLNFGIGNLRTGILNVADLSVTFGAIAFIILQFRAESKKENAAESE